MRNSVNTSARYAEVSAQQKRQQISHHYPGCPSGRYFNNDTVHKFTEITFTWQQADADEQVKVYPNEYFKNHNHIFLTIHTLRI